ncbi:MAG: zinc-ribbon domain-containing protein [Spirochaetaceae bacterium]|nr:zinc-ribbon domain-containing protein [Spirochaetaceae bacterium]
MAFCSNCGMKLEEGTKFCLNCGTKLAEDTAQPPQYNPPVKDVEDKKLRHGFTSFWLWANFIGNLLVTAGLFVFHVLGSELFESSYYDDNYFMLAVGISAWGLYFIIFKWKKFGFYMLLFVTIAATGIDLLHSFEVDRLQCFISFAISNAILYGVLHFRNAFNAKTTWEQLH